MTTRLLIETLLSEVDTDITGNLWFYSFIPRLACVLIHRFGYLSYFFSIHFLFYFFLIWNLLPREMLDMRWFHACLGKRAKT